MGKRKCQAEIKAEQTSIEGRGFPPARSLCPNSQPSAGICISPWQIGATGLVLAGERDRAQSLAGDRDRAQSLAGDRAQGTSLPCQKHPNPNNSMRLQPEPALKAEPELSTASCPGWIQDGPCPPGWSLGTPGLSRGPEWDLLDPALGRERGLKGGCRVHRAHCSHLDMQD